MAKPAGEGGGLRGEVGDAGFAAGDAVAEVLDLLRGDGCGGVEAARRTGRRSLPGGAGGLVDDGDELAAYFGGGVEQWGFELLAESSDGGFDVADHAVEAFARVLGGTADVFLHGGLEVGEADFAVGDHVAGRFGGGVEMIGKILQDGDAGAHELEHVVALQFAFRGDLREDQAHVLEAAAADLGGVADRGQHSLEVAALLDAGCDERGGDACGVARVRRPCL